MSLTGSAHLAYKAEQAVDLEHGTIVGVSVQGGAKGDTESLHETLEEAFEQVSAVTADEAVIEEIVADRGYHSNNVLADIDELGLRSYIAEPDRGRRRWKGKKDLQAIVYANRRRIRGSRASGCSASEGNGLNGLSLTSTRPAACGACICAVARTSSNECSLTPARATSGS